MSDTFLRTAVFPTPGAANFIDEYVVQIANVQKLWKQRQFDHPEVWRVYIETSGATAVPYALFPTEAEADAEILRWRNLMEAVK